MPTGITVIVSAFFALIGIIISKENKVSEFRQKWIDEFREETSLIISHSLVIQGISIDIAFVLKETLSGETPEDKEKYRREKNKEIQEHYSIVNKSAASIKLRVNETKFLSQLDKLLNSFTAFIQHLYEQNQTSSQNSSISTEMQKVVFELNEFIPMSKILLDSEWEKVEKGEKVFSSATKWVKTLLISATMVVMLSWISELPQIKKLFISDSISKSEITLRVIEETS